MPALIEVQARLRGALVEGAAEHVLPLLRGGDAAAKRLAIHQRHYRESLVAALLTKFPGCVWLVGDRLLREAAAAFVRSSPPSTCIAEYGEGFPRFLANRPEVLRLPYLQSFAELEWHLGCVAIAIEHPSITMDDLATVQELVDVILQLQPGVVYFSASWPVDELIELFLAESRPERFVFEPASISLQLSGARGSFRIKRLDRSAFAFRAAIAERDPIGVAAEHAIATDTPFEPGGALAALVAEKLVTAVITPGIGVKP